MLPVFSACFGDALGDAGFLDVAGIGAEDAVNCLAYYGVAVSASQDRFGAGHVVSRAELALVLYRAGLLAGVEFGDADDDVGMDGDAAMDAESRAAVAALVAAGVLSDEGGVSGVPVTRAEAVAALVALLRLASPGLFDASGVLKLGEGSLDHFADARDGAVAAAASHAFELGLTTGSAGDGSRFDPDGRVLRKNLASFVSRWLAHTGVRPAGVTAQADGGTVVVSVRDEAFGPVAGAVVDGFYVSTQRRYRAFDLRGGCNALVRSVNRTSTACAIDARDPVTGADGDVKLDELSAAAIGRGVTVWVWSGDRGDSYNENSVDGFELRIAGDPDAVTVPAATAVVPAAPAGGGGGGGSTPATTTTTTTTTPATTTTTTATTTTTTTTMPLGQVAAESLSITPDDEKVAATKTTNDVGVDHYRMSFGDWSQFTVQLLYTDENDNDKVKRAAFGADGTNPVLVDARQFNIGGHVTSFSQTSNVTPAVVALDVGNVLCDPPCSDAGGDVAHHNLKTDSTGKASFAVSAPADPNPGTAGDRRTLILQFVEEINGPASPAITNLPNKRFHVVNVLVSDGARTTSGTAPTTTVPSGNAAASITVTSNGAKTDKTFPAGETSTTFVEADYGDEVSIKIQLKDSTGADTTVGADGTTRAAFNLHRLYFPVGGHGTSVGRGGARTFTAAPASLKASQGWEQYRRVRYTGADGSLTFSAWMDDPNTGTSGTSGSVLFLIRSQTNAPNATNDLGTTPFTAGIVRLSEPSG